jgi:predicted site-specific integrase-resolvase
MKLSDWADSQGISRQTAYAWYHAGKLPVPARRAGKLILVDAPVPGATNGSTVIYARVSSGDQKADLDRQVARVTNWATASGMSVDRVVTEVGSALNGKRAKFLALLRDPDVTVIVVEHRDRFARFGVEYIEAALSAQQRKLVVVEEAELEDGLVRDMTELLTSFCARLYGRRAAKNKAAAAMNAIRAA